MSRKSHRRRNKLRDSKVMESLTLNINNTKEKDINGNIIHNVDTIDGIKKEYWVDYDGMLPVHFKNSNGYEWWCTYTKANCIKEFWDNTGYFEEYRYFKNNIILCTNSFGERYKAVIPKTKDSYISRIGFRAVQTQY